MYIYVNQVFSDLDEMFMPGSFAKVKFVWLRLWSPNAFINRTTTFDIWNDCKMYIDVKHVFSELHLKLMHVFLAKVKFEWLR